ncbi:MAG: replicative DNA helicase [Bdellovibrionales bacterium]|nr:replicative DNA helicase [Bdellovibrionales bacterium]
MMVISSLLIDPAAWDSTVGVLREESFYKPAHQKIFAAIQELHRRNQPIDVVVVRAELEKRDELQQVGGMPFLADLAGYAPSSANIRYYCEMIAEKATLRAIIRLSTEAIETAFSGQYDSVDSFLHSTEQRLFNLTQNRTLDSSLSSAADVVRESIERIEMIADNPGLAFGVSSGFKDLDFMTSGWKPQELIIVAARPSMGKTALGLNMAVHAAVRAKKKVAFFSLEMSKSQIMTRLLAMESQLGMREISTGKIPPNGWNQLINAAAVVSESGLFIDDTSGISPQEIRAKCRRLKSQHGLDMIMIDYLQMMKLKDRVDSREQEVAEISRTLKGIAKELNIPVVSLAQLNRAAEGRKDRRPILSDLRESGSIEQDADIIMMIYRDEYYEKEQSESKGVAEIIIGKQRNGPVGTVKLAWLPQHGVFRDLTYEKPPENRPPGGGSGSGGGAFPPSGNSAPKPAGPGGPMKNFARP